MDVAAVRPAELTAPGGHRGVAPLAVAVVVLAGLVVVLVLLLVSAGSGAAASARSSAAAAARAEALALTTISYQSADADLDRILAGATGKLRAQFAAEKPHFADTLAPQKSVSRGDVLAVGVVSSSTSQAQVDVAVDASVTTTSATGRKQSTLTHYRMVMRLVRSGGRWLVSDVAFAGAPQ